jgi:hypothetical protein
MRRPIAFTVSDLLEELEQFDPDAEVRLATQPSWPFEWSLSNTDPAVEVDLDGQPVVYLVEGTQLGYLPAAVRDQLGWQPAPPQTDRRTHHPGEHSVADLLVRLQPILELGVSLPELAVIGPHVGTSLVAIHSLKTGVKSNDGLPFRETRSESPPVMVLNNPSRSRSSSLASTAITRRLPARLAIASWCPAPPTRRPTSSSIGMLEA